MIQTTLVIVLICAAAAYLGLRAYKAWNGKKQKGCEKCGKPE